MIHIYIILHHDCVRHTIKHNMTFDMTYVLYLLNILLNYICFDNYIFINVEKIEREENNIIIVDFLCPIAWHIEITVLPKCQSVP